MRKKTITLASIAIIISASIYSSTGAQQHAPGTEYTPKITKVANNLKNGWHKGTFYNNGKKFTGTNRNIYYYKGKKYTGKINSKQYINGKLFSGIYKDIHYKNGYKYTGYSGGLYYKAGKVLTGHSEVIGYDSLGNKSPIYFKKGLQAKKGYYDFNKEGIKRYYSNGVLAQGFYNINGINVFFENGLRAATGFVYAHDVRYYVVNGIKHTGFLKRAQSDITYYKNGIALKGIFNVQDNTFIGDPKKEGQIFVGLINFNGKYYYANESGALYKNTTHNDFIIDANGVITNYHSLK
ncbi:hypothetical protein ACFVP8_16135 [Viridibacillus arvi]|uniref:hypothetical protein n=1 Tax=Viridibacillus arvi TaxID=263475 RepID=UPI00369530C3